MRMEITTRYGTERVVALEPPFERICPAYRYTTVATIRDTVYIDGGYMLWSPGMQNGEYGTPVHDRK